MLTDHDNGFDDGGNPAPMVGFDYGEVDPPSPDLDRREFLVRLFSKLVGGDLDPMRVGQRVIALAYLTRIPELSGLTQRELAARLGLHESNASRLISASKDFLHR